LTKLQLNWHMPAQLLIFVKVAFEPEIFINFKA